MDIHQDSLFSRLSKLFPHRQSFDIAEQETVKQPVPPAIPATQKMPLRKAEPTPEAEAEALLAVSDPLPDEPDPALLNYHLGYTLLTQSATEKGKSAQLRLLEKAVSHYELVLQHCSNHTEIWAATHQYLGLAKLRQALLGNKRQIHLNEAIRHYRRAQSFYTGKARYTDQNADALYQLGNAYFELSKKIEQMKKSECLEHSLMYFENALRLSHDSRDQQQRINQKLHQVLDALRYL